MYSNPYYNSSYDEYAQRQKSLKQQQEQPFSEADAYPNQTPIQLSGQVPMSNGPTKGPSKGSNNIFTGNNSGTYGNIANQALGAIDANNPNNNNQPADEKKVDDTGNAVASSFGPWWGAMTKAGTITSKKWRGKGMVSLDSNGNSNHHIMDNARNVNANVTDPFNMFKDPGAQYGKNKNLRTVGNIFLGGVPRMLGSFKQVSNERKRIILAQDNKRAMQNQYNTNQYNQSQYDNQQEEYNKRMNKTNRMNNLYSIPKTYQQMF